MAAGTLSGDAFFIIPTDSGYSICKLYASGSPAILMATTSNTSYATSVCNALNATL